MTSGELKELLAAKTHRHVEGILWMTHLHGSGQCFDGLSKAACIKECVKALNMESSINFKTGDRFQELVNKYEKLYEESILPEEYFDWIDGKSERICNFLIESLNQRGLIRDVTLLVALNDPNKKRFIIRVMDRSILKLSKKFGLLIELRRLFGSNLAYTGSDYSWLNQKNEYQCRKAISFINKQTDNRFGLYEKPTLIQTPFVLSDYELFLLSLDLWGTSRLAKETFHNKISDAARKWKTNNRIVKRKTKKVVNTRTEITDKLQLSKLEDLKTGLGQLSIEDTLEELISKRHDELLKEKRDKESLDIALEEIMNKCFDDLLKENSHREV